MALNSPNPAAIVVKGLMDEANQDGKQYARQDGEWSEVAPAAGKNILINGNLTIDQRGKSAFGHALPTNDFVWDRWMLVANGSPQIYQIIEEGNYEPNTVYTLSWESGTTQQATSPASGHWNIKNSFSVLPQWSSKKIQLEKGDTATEFEREDVGTTLAKCQRYYYRISGKQYLRLGGGICFNNSAFSVHIAFPVSMRNSSQSISVSNAAHFMLMGQGLPFPAGVQLSDFPTGASSHTGVDRATVSGGYTGLTTASYYEVFFRSGSLPSDFIEFDAELPA